MTGALSGIVGLFVLLEAVTRGWARGALGWEAF